MSIIIPKPEYDAVLRFYPYKIELAFAYKISPEIVQDIESIGSDAIVVKRERGAFSPLGCYGVLIGHGSDDLYRRKENESAQEFSIDFLPVWEPVVLAESIARGLENSHRLKVKVIDDTPPENREKVSKVIK